MTQTHFGYETVDEAEKAGKVRGVFDSVAKKYDVMNDLMSGGLHRAWKAYTVAVANLKAGDKALDIAGGTGDLAPDAWKPLFADADVGPGLATIAWLGGDVDIAADAEDRPDEDELEDPQVRDTLSRAAADVVLKLWARKA